MTERIRRLPEGLFTKEQEGLGAVCPMFKGQGSLNRRELIKFIDKCQTAPVLNEEVRALYDRADSILNGYSFWREQLKARKKALGKKEDQQVSLLELEDEDLLNTAIAQPATFVFNEVNRIAEEKGRDIKPLYYLGNSLGEINAVLAAGGFKSENGQDGNPDGGFKNALNLVFRRGRLMHEACRGENGSLIGGLIAVRIPDNLIGDKGPTGEQKTYFKNFRELLLKKNKKDKFELFLEADNSDTQAVFAGKEEDLNNALEWISQNSGSIRAGRLPVEGAFHCKLMREAEEDFSRTVRWYLKTGRIKDLDVEIIANTIGIPIRKADEIAAELIRHITRPVLWRQSTNYAKRKGATLLFEYGEKAVLTRMEDPKAVNIVKGVAGAAGALAIAFAVYAIVKKSRKG